MLAKYKVILYISCMKLFLFLVALIFSVATFAQTIEKYYDYQWKETKPELSRFVAVIDRTDSGWHRRDYFLQEKSLQMEGTYDDSACKIPNGKFRYFHSNGNPDRVGSYVHGKKEGLWLDYHYNGMMSDSTTYSNNHKIGASYGWYEDGSPSDSAVYNADGSGVMVGWFNNGNPSFAGRYGAGGKMNGRWVFYHSNGKVSATEFYNNGVLADKQYFDEKGQATDTTNNDKAASFKGGIKEWQRYLNNKLYFPTNYKLINGDRAIVVIEAVIDEEGNVTNVAVNTPFHPAFDKIAVEVIKKSPRWEPAISHNRKVIYRIKQPVVFRQE